ncbi:LexA family transcriptional regulator [Pseudomonas veronii]|uniref:LexA family transcriptional regulator n=1 Tax=Pseudomonas veronii TaxID=76761 RepID=UPI002D798068|nr:helix-turn-helix transcriptional regulator [Pseudomonas veronii]WRU61078.1 helix-turn-helix transcriptional regulator [Pseudomonas veronii]
MSYDEKKQKKPTGKNVSFPYSGLETRIAAVADLYESRKQAALTADAALSSLQRWIAGEGMPAFDSVALLANAKGVSLDWIATGKGEMFVGEAKKAPVTDIEDVYSHVPLYDARCSAGHGSWTEGARVLTHLAFTTYSLRKKGLEASKLSAIRVDGDSMEGLLSDGDTVMIDHGRNSLEGEAIYVIRLDDHLYAKRLQRQFDGSVSIISQNKEYQPMVVPKERLGDLEIIGRVVWAGGWI